MEHVSSIIGHLAWPVVALIVAYWVVRELRGGLVSYLLPYGGTLKTPGGFEFEVKAAGVALTAAGIEKKPTSAERPASSPGALVEDETPYDQVIQSWREVSALIATLASQYGGKRDARYAYDNIALLEDKGVIGDEVAEVARLLFRARNSIRRLPPEQVTEEAAYDFAVNAGSLASYLKLLS